MKDDKFDVIWTLFMSVAAFFNFFSLHMEWMDAAKVSTAFIGLLLILALPKAYREVREYNRKYVDR